MARYVEIDRNDFQKLLDGYSYVIERYSEKDTVMCNYLREILDTVKKHHENETKGEDDNETCSQIEFILDFLGDMNGQIGDPSRS